MAVNKDPKPEVKVNRVKDGEVYFSPTESLGTSQQMLIVARFCAWFQPKDVCPIDNHIRVS
jgi:hypothetical protein